MNPKGGGKTFVQVYTDHSTATWEQTVALVAKEQIRRIPQDDDGEIRLPFDGRVLLEMRFNLERPKSLPKAIKYPMRSRSDVDNLAKSVMDGLQKAGILSNDNIVTDLAVQKRFADAEHPEGVEIDVTTLM